MPAGRAECVVATRRFVDSISAQKRKKAPDAESARESRSPHMRRAIGDEHADPSFTAPLVDDRASLSHLVPKGWTPGRRHSRTSGLLRKRAIRFLRIRQPLWGEPFHSSEQLSNGSGSQMARHSLRLHSPASWNSFKNKSFGSDGRSRTVCRQCGSCPETPLSEIGTSFLLLNCC